MQTTHGKNSKYSILYSYMKYMNAYSKLTLLYVDMKEIENTISKVTELKEHVDLALIKYV